MGAPQGVDGGGESCKGPHASTGSNCPWTGAFSASVEAGRQAGRRCASRAVSVVKATELTRRPLRSPPGAGHRSGDDRRDTLSATASSGGVGQS